MGKDMAQAIVGNGGILSQGGLMKMDGFSNEGSSNALKEIMGLESSACVVVKKKTETPKGEPAPADPLKLEKQSKEQRAQTLRQKLADQGEKARWYSQCLEPFDIAQDMSSGMKKHATFMETAFKKLNAVMATSQLSLDQITAYEQVCEPHFAWFLKREKAAHNMERDLIPKTKKNAQKKNAVGTDTQNSQPSTGGA